MASGVTTTPMAQRAGCLVFQSRMHNIHASKTRCVFACSADLREGNYQGQYSARVQVKKP